MKSSIDISPEFNELYNQYSQLGYNYFKDLNICVVGIARDVEATINGAVLKFCDLKPLCKNLDILVVENDSIDTTKDKLKQLKQSHKINYISKDFGLPKFGTVKDKERTIALANHRNIYIDYLNNYSAMYDYIIVCDWDFIDFNRDGLMNTFGWLSDGNIKAMCGISVRYQHVLSQKHKNYWNYDCWAYRENWWIDKQTEVNDTNSMLWFGFWIPPVGSPPFKVNSGFGGMCVYKSEYLLNSQYEGYDCEHVCLHKSMYTANSDFSLSLNPSQLILLD